MIHLLFIMSASLLCSLPLDLVETSRLAILLGKSYSFCSSSVLSEKCFVMFMYFLSNLMSMLGHSIKLH